MSFEDRVGNPFDSEWAREAYQHASYMSVTTGLEFDRETGTLKTKLRFTDKIIEGSPADVLTNRGFQEGMGTIETEAARINMAFMLGYALAELGLKKLAKEIKADG